MDDGVAPTLVLLLIFISRSGNRLGDYEDHGHDDFPSGYPGSKNNPGGIGPCRRLAQ